MEPLKINVNIEVGLKQTTLEALAAIFNPCKSCTCTGTEADPQPEAKTEATAPLPEVPATVEDYDDLPPSDAPAPAKKTPTEDDARKAVKAARDRGVSAKTIKELMKTGFDIAASVECPAERRQELIEALNKLAA